MAHINLLPWREEAREARQKSFIMMLVLSALFAGGILYAGMMFMDDLITKQTSRNSYLQKEISLLDGKIKEIAQLDEKRESLLAKTEVIEDLQGDRIKAVKLLDALAKTMPQGIHLTSIKRSGEQFLLSGKAQANARVSAFMRELDENEVFAKSNLSVVARAQAEKTFTLSVTEKKDDDEEDE